MLLAYGRPVDDGKLAAWPGRRRTHATHRVFRRRRIWTRRASPGLWPVLGEIPQRETHLGWLWRLIDLSARLVHAGARADLAARCAGDFVGSHAPRCWPLADAGLSHAEVIRALIMTGMAATAAESPPWDPADESVLERLWTAFPAAAASPR